MGTRDSRKAHGAEGKKDLLLFDADALVLVDDESHDLYDERVHIEPDEKMILNILTYGVLEPVLVRKNTESGKTEIIDGRQRVKACREANKRIRKAGGEEHRVPAVVKRIDAGGAIGVMISTNDQRIEDTPMNRARKASRMLERGKTEEEVGVALGVSSATVKNLLKLLDAPAVVRHAVDAGKISATDGYKLARMEVDDAKKTVEQLIEQAPRTPGKKRSRNASRARAIVGGGKKKSKSNGSARQSDTSLRSPNQIENIAREVSESDKPSGPVKTAVAAFAAWVLGESDDLTALGL